jgi:excisionase family DNA binding protein
VFQVIGIAHPKEVREMLQPALSRSFAKPKKKLHYLMITHGLSGLDIVKQIHREIFSMEIKMPEELKVMIANYIGEIQFRLVEGAGDEIQLNAFLATLSRWVREGRIRAVRTAGGELRIPESEARRIAEGLPTSKGIRAVVYARVSSSDKRSELEKQIRYLIQYCTSKGYRVVDVLSIKPIEKVCQGSSTTL